MVTPTVEPVSAQPRRWSAPLPAPSPQMKGCPLCDGDLFPDEPHDERLWEMACVQCGGRFDS
jgi:hypothetical protein